MKKCNVCSISKDISEYHKHSGRKDGHNETCKECRKLTSKCTDKVYKRHIKWKYGISLDQYNTMLVSQEYRCKICKKLPTEENKNRRLAVDHCHDTGEVRGLLCDRCNRGLGYFKDNLELLKQAIRYLNDAKNI